MKNYETEAVPAEDIKPGDRIEIGSDPHVTRVYHIRTDVGGGIHEIVLFTETDRRAINKWRKRAGETVQRVKPKPETRTVTVKVVPDTTGFDEALKRAAETIRRAEEAGRAVGEALAGPDPFALPAVKLDDIMRVREVGESLPETSQPGTQAFTDAVAEAVRTELDRRDAEAAEERERREEIAARIRRWSDAQAEQRLVEPLLGESVKRLSVELEQYARKRERR